MSVPVTFLRYIGSDDMIELSLWLTIYTSSGIKCTGSGSSGSDVGLFFCLMNYSITGTRSCSFIVRNICMVSYGLNTFHSYHLMSLLITTLLVSGLYSLYGSLVWFPTYPTIITLNVLSFIWPLMLSLFMTYAIHQNPENEPIIIFFIIKTSNRIFWLLVAPITFCAC